MKICLWDTLLYIHFRTYRLCIVICPIVTQKKLTLMIICFDVSNAEMVTVSSILIPEIG